MAADPRTSQVHERRAIWLLGLPTFGLALSITVVTTYLPLIAQEFTDSSIVVGVLIGSEGLLALALPLVVGTWSDQLKSPIGGRLPFLLVATPPLAISLALLGFAGSLVIALGLVWLFFAAYFVAYEPYRALYPDLVSDANAGKSQSVQAIWRGAATGLALVAGGLLFDLEPWIPFVVSAVVTAAVMFVFLHIMVRAPGRRWHEPEHPKPLGAAVRELRSLVEGRPGLQAYLAANALWEASLGALKTFVLLYVTVGLGIDVADAALIVGAAATFVLGGAVVSGILADRYGQLPVLRVTLIVYGFGLLIPAVTTATLPLALIAPLAAFGGGTLMTLPYALLMPHMPAGSHGALTGFYSLSRGIGTMLGPLLTGLAVQLLRGPFDGTEGYQAMWLVCGGTVLASLFFVRRMSAALRAAT
ncbi:MFS transporter [Conexibacter woesei]|uniref:Major facilitator superfamily MFS_1 n=1 Tax=Conexibacter woesei (strain DSM 14684 / CCUG 47730 / CIP 108061 / JCM 11494 / NBRC 100937 / ID131577) TaxID=469383 RepID=D3FEZ0_CONWI|nr:MFS transporter [Conexibacter woesei]ADB51707.1 major facilitator superfamily MFS_1 [Conexibacter woesei DSM 14684]